VDGLLYSEITRYFRTLGRSGFMKVLNDERVQTALSGSSEVEIQFRSFSFSPTQDQHFMSLSSALEYTKPSILNSFVYSMINF
jgi:hypothetical protein